jgi:ketol-acid reductoisomerase
VLADIQSGRFARDWMLENKVNQSSFKATRRRLSEHPIEEVGAKLRDMMPWIKKGALVDKTKNQVCLHLSPLFLRGEVEILG